MRALASVAAVVLASACVTHGPNIPSPLVHAPSDPGGPAPTTDAVTAFAIDAFDFGEESSDGYASLGLDIDGQATASGTPHCQTIDESTPGSEPASGIDNAFGRSLWPLIVTFLAPEATSQANASFATGGRVNLLVAQGLTGKATVSPVVLSMQQGLPLGAQPRWDGTDRWPVDGNAPALAFSRSYVVQESLVGEPPSGGGQLVLGLIGSASDPDAGAGFGPLELVIPVTHVQIVAPLAADGSITNGVLSGIIPVSGALALGGQFAAATRGSVFSADSYQMQVNAAADILVDGTQDPSRTCDGISLGLGFTARPVKTSP